jgi:hypothetical protein
MLGLTQLDGFSRAALAKNPPKPRKLIANVLVQYAFTSIFNQMLV